MKKIKKIFLNLKEAIERHRQLSIDKENAHSVAAGSMVIVFERKDSVSWVVYLEESWVAKKKNLKAKPWCETMALVNYYRKQGFVVEIKNNLRSVLEITKEILIYGNYPPVIIELKPEDIK